MKETHRRAFPPAASRFRDERPFHPKQFRGAFLSQNIFSYIHTKLAAQISHGYRDRHQCLMQAWTLARCPCKQKTRPMISKNIMDRIRLFLFYSILSLAPGFPAASGNPASTLSITSILLLLSYYFYPITSIPLLYYFSCVTVTADRYRPP